MLCLGMGDGGGGGVGAPSTAGMRPVGIQDDCREELVGSSPCYLDPSLLHSIVEPVNGEEGETPRAPEKGIPSRIWLPRCQAKASL